MQIIIFTLVAIALYLGSDWLVREIERRRGAVLKYRSILFFAIFLSLALVSFQLLQVYFRSGNG